MMDPLDLDDLDNDQWETVVSVHSPVIRSNQKGNYFTTYSISLKSNNTCFSQPFSCVHRRYSEFSRLKNLLEDYHPNVESPSLPPKKLFRRFDQSFINERTEGLQTFIRSVLNTSVYLSNKGVHLFLQTQKSMSEIEELVSGHLPAIVPAQFSDSCSDTSSDHLDGCNLIDDLEEFAVDFDGDLNHPVDEIGVDAKELITDSDNPCPVLDKSLSEPIPILQPYLRSALISSAGNSLNTTPASLSPVSTSVDSALLAGRRVSFCDKVKVATVRDRLWNFDTRPMRNCAS